MRPRNGHWTSTCLTNYRKLNRSLYPSTMRCPPGRVPARLSACVYNYGTSYGNILYSWQLKIASEIKPLTIFCQSFSSSRDNRGMSSWLGYGSQRWNRPAGCPAQVYRVTRHHIVNAIPTPTARKSQPYPLIRIGNHITLQPNSAILSKLVYRLLQAGLFLFIFWLTFFLFTRNDLTQRILYTLVVPPVCLCRPNYLGAQRSLLC